MEPAATIATEAFHRDRSAYDTKLRTADELSAKSTTAIT